MIILGDFLAMAELKHFENEMLIVFDNTYYHTGVLIYTLSTRQLTT